MTEREQLYALVETIPDSELKPATRFLEFLRDQTPDAVSLALDRAPLDDEPLTKEDVTALEEALQDRDQGRVFPHEEIRSDLLGEATFADCGASTRAPTA